ncbi:transcriptional regulator [Helicobacter winghamensis]|uniref:transcriptional regulator n=1 Tax=Helicobacter winghamensis TaxID=157268 RepID=UPI0027A962FD
MNDSEQNLIKKTCKELGLTYRELGERIGFNGDTLNNMASKPNEQLSLQLTRAIELYRETIELKRKLETLENLKVILKNLVQ